MCCSRVGKFLLLNLAPPKQKSRDGIRLIEYCVSIIKSRPIPYYVLNTTLKDAVSLAMTCVCVKRASNSAHAGR